MVPPGPIRPAAYLDAVLQDGDQEVIQLALWHVVEAQEVGQGDDDLRFSPDGCARFETLMAQAEEIVKAGKILPVTIPTTSG